MKPSGSHPARPRADLLTVRIVAEELCVCEKTVRRLISAGELPSYRIGRAIRVAEDDLATFRKLRRS